MVFIINNVTRYLFLQFCQGMGVHPISSTNKTDRHKTPKYSKMSMKMAPKTNRPLSKNDFLGCFLKRRKLTTYIYNLDIHA